MCSATEYDNGMTIEPDNQSAQPRRRLQFRVLIVVALILAVLLICVRVGLLVGPVFRHGTSQSKLEMYQRGWARKGGSVNDDASCDDAVARNRPGTLSMLSMTGTISGATSITPAQDSAN